MFRLKDYYQGFNIFSSITRKFKSNLTDTYDFLMWSNIFLLLREQGNQSSQNYSKHHNTFIRGPVFRKTIPTYKTIFINSYNYIQNLVNIILFNIK